MPMLSGIINTIGTRGLSALLNFAIIIAVSRYLGPEGKGEQGLFLATIAYILVFSHLASGALVFLSPRYPIGLLIFPAYLWSVITGAFAYVFLIFFYSPQAEYALELSLLAVLGAFSSINSGILIGRECIKRANLVALIQPVLTLIILLMLFNLAEKSSYMYLIALFASYFASMLLGLVYLNLLPKEEALFEEYYNWKKVMIRMFSLGFMNQTAHILQITSFRLSYYWLEKAHGNAAVGVYSNASSLAESIWLIAKSISLVQYARIANSQDTDASRAFTIKLSRMTLWLTFVLLLPLVILPSSFYTWLFGNGFELVKRTIVFLSPGTLVYSLSLIFGHYFSGRGLYKNNALASLLGLMAAICGFYLLIPKYATTGTAIAASLSYIITASSVIFLFYKEKPFPFIDLLRIDKTILELKTKLQRNRTI